VKVWHCSFSQLLAFLFIRCAIEPVYFDLVGGQYQKWLW